MNQLEILIKAKDEASGTIAGLNDLLDGVKKNISVVADVSAASAAKIGVSFALAEEGLKGMGEVAKHLFEVFSEGAEKLAEYSEQMMKVHEKTGLSIDSLQVLSVAAKMSGTDLDSVGLAVTRMEVNLEKGSKAFGYLGLSVSDLKAMAPDEAFEKIGAAIGGIEDPMQRTAAAIAIFGKSGATLLPLFAENLEETKAKAEELGLVLSDHVVESGKALHSQLVLMEAAFGAMQMRIGAAIADSPILTGTIAAISKAYAEMGKSVTGNKQAFEDFSNGTVDYLNRFALGTIQVAEWVVTGFQAIKLSVISLAEAFVALNQLNPMTRALFPVDKWRADLKAMADATKSSFTSQMNDLTDIEAALKKFVENQHALANGIGGKDGKKGGSFLMPDPEAVAEAKEAAKEAKAEWKEAMSEMEHYIELEKAGSMEATRARAEEWKEAKALMMGYIEAEIAGSHQADAARKEHFREIKQQIDDFLAAEEKGSKEADAERKVLATERWKVALQGVAMLAGLLPGKFGESLKVIENIGKSFEDWNKMGSNGKFGAVAGAVGQIGGLIGGSGGSALQGAAGGAMTGFSIGGPVGAAIGGVAGGILGLFGASAAKKKELADLKTQLSALSDEAKKFGINLDSAFASKNSSVVKAAIDSVNAAMKESEKRIAGLATASGGLNAFAKGGGITDQASSDRAGLYAGAIFGGMVKETGDVVAALKAIGPALADMAAKAKEMGLSLGAGVANLLGMSDVLAANGGLADQISGLNQMMKGLGDAGLVTKDLFAAFGADASAVFARLIEGGATSNQALSLMQPTLQQLYEGQKLHGFAVDEATQALLDQAEAEGIVGDSFMSANERIVELLGILVETLGGTIPDSLRRMGNAAEEQFGRMSTAAGNVHLPGFVGPNPGNGSGLQEDGGAGFAGGTAFRNFGAGSRVTLHGEEAVLTRPQVDRLLGMAIGGASVSPAAGGGSRDVSAPIVIHNYLTLPDGRVLLSVTTDAMRSEGRESQEFRAAFNGAR